MKNSFIEFVEEPSNIRRSRSADDMLESKARRLEISSPFAIVVQCGGEGATTAWAEGSSGNRLLPPRADDAPASPAAPGHGPGCVSPPPGLSDPAAPSEPAAQASPGEAAQEETSPTTVMLRPIPASYTRALILEMLDEAGFQGKYDFVYLPMDFTRGIGLGYALVSLLTTSFGEEVIEAFNGFTAWTVPSDAVCMALWSEPRQGYAEHLERYRNSPVMHHSVPDEYKPAIFADGKRIAFPPPTKSIRAPRVRYLKAGESAGSLSLNKATASDRKGSAPLTPVQGFSRCTSGRGAGPAAAQRLH